MEEVTKYISIRGAREHNLKNIDVDIPREKFIVITGVSGSGKSSLAFDTIYAEGQRRYIESLSTYARQFLEQFDKAKVDLIKGLPPTIAIEQRRGVVTPRSTVATQSEIYDYLRVLFAKVGTPYCYKCGRPIRKQSTDEIIGNIQNLPAKTKITILAPVVAGRKGEHKEVFQTLKKQGFLKIRIDGKTHELNAIPEIDKNKKHNIEVVVDRFTINEGSNSRLAEAVELGLKLGNGVIKLEYVEGTETKEILFSELYACPYCNVSIPEISPRIFSFNSPYGACSLCSGLGTRMEIDVDLLIPNKDLSIAEGAFDFIGKIGKYYSLEFSRLIRNTCYTYDIDTYVPFKEIPEYKKQILLYGNTNGTSYTDSEGVIPNLLRVFYHTSSEYFKERLLNYMSETPCPECKGSRLKKEALFVRINGKNIYELTQLSVKSAYEFFNQLNFTGEKEIIAKPIIKEIKDKLSFLINVGLDYLTLERKTSSLSGGEFQRTLLATQVGSGLVGICYVLDEPTIGLHERDTIRLIQTLYKLKNLGNTVIVIEHDEEMIRSAEHIIDIGPRAGVNGGRIVAQGTLNDIISSPESITGNYLSRKLSIKIPEKRRTINSDTKWLTIYGAKEHNLKNITVSFPLRKFVCVTGVSGSGKSTLVYDTLYKALARKLYRGKEKPGEYEKLSGEENIDKVIDIDQSPIGRTTRSNPATYTGVFTEIRNFFAQLKESKKRGYLPGRFSFNVKGGRCEACEGQGYKLIEMHFLPNVYVPCEVCKGKRYNNETLQVVYKGKNIADVLEASVDEAIELFQYFPRIKEKLKVLQEVGLGYISLGQESTKLSGGEAQRVKLAAELARAPTGNTLYILDEPSTGLHFDDINKLVNVLQRLVDRGNTVIVIEHNMHIIKVADYIIDLGPEGGEQGGEVIATGTPEEIANCPSSYTGRYLKKYLSQIP